MNRLYANEVTVLSETDYKALTAAPEGLLSHNLEQSDI